MGADEKTGCASTQQFAEKGTRIDDLKAILERVTAVSTLFDADGISIRAMNLPVTVSPFS